MQTKAFRETDVWAEDLKNGISETSLTPARIGEGTWQQSGRVWKIRVSATQHLFQTESFDSHSKSLPLLTAGPHKGDTNPLCSHTKMQATLLQKNEGGGVPKICFPKIFVHNEPHWKSIQCGKRAQCHSSIKCTLNQSWAFPSVAWTLGADWTY